MKIQKKVILFAVNILTAFYYLSGITNNKTFLSHTPNNSIVHQSLQSYRNESFNTNLTVNYAYVENYNKSNLRNYFLPYTKETTLFGSRTNPSTNALSDLDYLYFIHLVDAEDRTVSLFLKPEQQINYIEAQLYHEFLNTKKPFFITVRLPFVHVSNHLNPCFKSEGFESDEDSEQLKKFFAGSLTIDSPSQQQAALKNLTFTNKKTASSGSSDIHLMIGCHTINTATKNATLAAGLIIPASNKPKNIHLFEAMRGNNGHWGIALHGEFDKILWKNSSFCFKGTIQSTVTYLIPNKQKRTLGIRHLPWGHYALLGKKEQEDEPLFPAANILTCRTNVNPGIQVDTSCTGAFITQCGILNFGYALMVKSEEGIGIKNQFLNETFGIADFGFDTTNVFTQNEVQNERWLTLNDIDLTVAQTPSQVTHGINLSISKIMEKKHLSCTLESGIQCSFCSENTVPVGITVWATIKTLF